MVFIYEDKLESSLTRFFVNAYTGKMNGEVPDYLVFADGASNLLASLINSQCLFPHEMFVVFVDVPPDNAVAVDTYNCLTIYAQNFVGSVWVIPIICAEYYLLKSVNNLSREIHLSNELYKKCLEVLPFDAFFEEHPEFGETPKNFEKLCKLYTYKYARGCFQTNVSDPKYFTVDCKCDTSLDSCTEQTLREKSISFVRCYPIYYPILTSESGVLTGNVPLELISEECFKFCESNIDKFIKERNTNKKRTMIPLYSLVDYKSYVNAYNIWLKGPMKRIKKQKKYDFTELDDHLSSEDKFIIDIRKFPIKIRKLKI